MYQCGSPSSFCSLVVNPKLTSLGGTSKTPKTPLALPGPTPKLFRIHKPFPSICRCLASSTSITVRHRQLQVLGAPAILPLTWTSPETPTLGHKSAALSRGGMAEHISHHKPQRTLEGLQVNSYPSSRHAGSQSSLAIISCFVNGVK